jgi:hypothetical protein
MYTMEMGKLNVYYIKSELKIGNITTSIANAYFTSATETEFGDLIDSYVTENGSEDLSGLISYITKNGITVLFYVRNY